MTNRFTRVYLTADPRSLAVGRIALALTMLASLFGRATSLNCFFTNDGLLPNHAVLWRPPNKYAISFFLSLSHWHEVAVGFLLCLVAFGALLIGYRTRLAQVLSFICLINLRYRVPALTNGGDTVLSLLAFWTMFLPTGLRYSVDARLERDPKVREKANEPIVSLAMLALSLQLAVIYFFNFIQKSGETWRDSSAIHYVLHQDRVVTALGVWVREHVNPEALAVFTRGTLVIEAVIPMLLLAPFARRATRRIALALIVMLHVGISLCMNLGIFSPVMIVFGLHLIAGEDWAALECWLGLGRREPAGPAPSYWREVRQHRAREIFLGCFLLLGLYQLLLENRALASVRPPRSQLVEAVVSYLAFFQGWSLFAPDAPKVDQNVSVDALTVDGRHVDPLNQVASLNPMPGLQIPSHLGQPALFREYMRTFCHRSQFHRLFVEWMRRYPERTGNPSDRLVSFKVYQVEDDSPPPGQLLPSNLRWRSCLAHRFSADE